MLGRLRTATGVGCDVVTVMDGAFGEGGGCPVVTSSLNVTCINGAVTMSCCYVLRDLDIGDQISISSVRNLADQCDDCSETAQ